MGRLFLICCCESIRRKLAFQQNFRPAFNRGIMATTPNPAPVAAPQATLLVATNAIIEAMLAMGKNVSDLILSPGRRKLAFQQNFRPAFNRGIMATTPNPAPEILLES